MDSIPQSSRWPSIFENEESFEIGNAICDLIIENSIAHIYEKYLEETSYAYIVHKSYLAWIEWFEQIDLHGYPLEPLQEEEEDVKIDKSVINHCTCRKV